MKNVMPIESYDPVTDKYDISLNLESSEGTFYLTNLEYDRILSRLYHYIPKDQIKVNYRYGVTSFKTTKSIQIGYNEFFITRVNMELPVYQIEIQLHHIIIQKIMYTTSMSHNLINTLLYWINTSLEDYSVLNLSGKVDNILDKTIEDHILQNYIGTFLDFHKVLKEFKFNKNRFYSNDKVYVIDYEVFTKSESRLSGDWYCEIILDKINRYFMITIIERLDKLIGFSGFVILEDLPIAIVNLINEIKNY